MKRFAVVPVVLGTLLAAAYPGSAQNDAISGQFRGSINSGGSAQHTINTNGASAISLIVVADFDATMEAAGVSDDDGAAAEFTMPYLSLTGIGSSVTVTVGTYSGSGDYVLLYGVEKDGWTWSHAIDRLDGSEYRDRRGATYYHYELPSEQDARVELASTEFDTFALIEAGDSGLYWENDDTGDGLNSHMFIDVSSTNSMDFYPQGVGSGGGLWVALVGRR